MKKHNRLLAMLMALAMVLAFMPAMAFAEDEETAGFDSGLASEDLLNESVPELEELSEELTPAEPETWGQEALGEGAVNFTVSFSPASISLYSNDIAYSDNGVVKYGLYKRGKVVVGGTPYDTPFIDGDTITFWNSNGTSEVYTYRAQFKFEDGTYAYDCFVYGNGEDGFYAEDIVFSDNVNNLVPGTTNTVEMNVFGAATTISVFVDTPELRNQREIAAAEAARQGTPDGKIPKVKVSKPKAGKKSATIKWKKLKKKQIKKAKVTNYEVWACANTGFAMGETSEHIIKKSKSGLKITKMPKGTYYIKVRAIRKVGDTKYVGPWSKAKKVKIR